MDKPKVLIIEDETALLYALNAELSTAGFSIQTSADGREGFERMKTDNPDFIILDIWLPSMNGLEILRARDKDEKLNKIPLLVITNSSSDKTMEEIKKFNVVDYFVKTEQSLTEITKKIKNILSNQ
ncbi:PleD family two-component system response regulator [Patescibacteria group bacterium]